MKKSAPNIRFTGPSVKLTDTMTMTPWEFVPDYGQPAVNTAPINGYNPDSQTEQFEIEFPVPTPEERRWISDPNNPQCPLYRFIGNAKAKERLSRAVYAAWGRPNHCCSDQSFALLGPSSAGKTTLARLYGEAVGLPFIEIQPKAVQNSRQLYMEIYNKLKNTVIPFAEGPKSLILLPADPECTNDPNMIVSPCVVFIDEVHALNRNIVPELLKATEPKDGMLSIGEGWYADCRNVCWIIATTERGLLFPPFENRFRKVQLDMYGADEIAQIMHLNHPSWNKPLCQLVAKYSSRVPREALAFAVDMQLERDKNGGDWKSIAARVARSHDIDRFGLTKKRLAILVALGQIGAVSKNRMCDFAQCQLEELERFQMPALLACTATEPAMVVVTSKGYAITHQGLAELEKRGIPHRGDEVVAGGLQKLDFGDFDADNFGDEDYPVVSVPVVISPDVFKPIAPTPEPKGFSALIQKLAKAMGR